MMIRSDDQEKQVMIEKESLPKSFVRSRKNRYLSHCEIETELSLPNPCVRSRKNRYLGHV